MNNEQKAELEQLAAKAPGKLLTAETVVEFASDESTALHKAFEWDDTEAAREYRLMQARQVIRVFVKYEPRAARSVRALVSVPSDRANTGGYRRTEDVLSNPNWVGEMVAEVQAKIRNLQQSYSYLRQLDPLWPRLDACVSEFLVELSKQRQAG